MASTDQAPQPVYVAGVLWDEDGNIGIDWEITVHDATSHDTALQACRERSDTITDWEVVDAFTSPPFSQQRTIHL